MIMPTYYHGRGGIKSKNGIYSSSPPPHDEHDRNFGAVKVKKWAIDMIK